MTPLAVLCGFLGAGKTTFLRALLPEVAAAGLRPRVVINDYQNAAVDAALLRDVAQIVEPVSGSCICCDSREELVGALAAVDGGPGQVALVEANGTTDTEAMLEILVESPALDHLGPPVQLTIVDAQRFGTRDWRNELERVQIRTATHVALSRRDLVDPARADEVRRAVSALAPRAEWTDAAAFARFLATLERSLAAVPDRSSLFMPLPAPGGAHGPLHHFASIELPLPHPVDPEAFAAFLRALPAEVIRAKGIVSLRDPVGGKRSFQKVEGVAEISDCELYEPETLPTTAIFIGVGLPVDAIQAQLAALAAT